MLGLWFAMQLVSGLGTASGTPGVAFWAHVGGFATGLILVTVLRPNGVALLQPQRSRGFAAVRPTAFTGRRTFYGGSVPPAGRRFIRPRSPWD
jgi:hypothetical protein